MPAMPPASKFRISRGNECNGDINTLVLLNDDDDDEDDEDDDIGLLRNAACAAGLTIRRSNRPLPAFVQR
jgi:hypothetical protein